MGNWKVKQVHLGIGTCWSGEDIRKGLEGEYGVNIHSSMKMEK
jgi:hypothetical protein